MSLLELPREIQDDIVKLLNFFDLNRLRMTCRRMRELPSDEVKHRALVNLEIDAYEWNNCGVQNLSEVAFKSYSAQDALKLSHFKRKFLACYSCFAYKRTSRAFEQFVEQTVTDILICDIFEGRKLEAEKMKADRKCIKCSLRTKSFAQRSPRYIRRLSDFIVACSCCGKIRRMAGCAGGRQKGVEMCDKCFEPEITKEREVKIMIALAKSQLRRLKWVLEGVYEGRVTEDMLDMLENGPSLPTIKLPKFKYLGWGARTDPEEEDETECVVAEGSNAGDQYVDEDFEALGGYIYVER